MKLYAFGAYLLLVSFVTGPGGVFTPEMADVVRVSPYDGITVRYDGGAYTHRSENTPKQVEKFKRIARMTGKDVWPWVFINRIVGYKGGGPEDETTPQKRYFRKIKGVDIFGDAGELDTFMAIWRGALISARESGSPGILLDLEPYNDYDVYNIEKLADDTGRSCDEVKAGLEAFGARLADEAAEDHPSAVIWCMFTNLWKEPRQSEPCGLQRNTMSLVVLGMLDRCNEKGYNITVVSGGETSLGFCSKDLADLRDKVRRRRDAFAKYLDMYPNLRLGGTMAPWVDAGGEGRRMAYNPACVSSELIKAEDFVSLFKELGEEYGYVWIFDPNYNAYDPVNSAVMNKALFRGFPLKDMARQLDRLPETLMPGIRPRGPGGR